MFDKAYEDVKQNLIRDGFARFLLLKSHETKQVASLVSSESGKSGRILNDPV